MCRQRKTLGNLGQQSDPVELEMGKYYYISALEKNKHGRDSLSVAVTLPNGEFLAPMPVEYKGEAMLFTGPGCTKDCHGIVPPAGGSYGDCPEDGTLALGKSCAVSCSKRATLVGIQPSCKISDTPIQISSALRCDEAEMGCTSIKKPEGARAKCPVKYSSNTACLPLGVRWDVWHVSKRR